MKMYQLLDELIMAGELQESSATQVVQSVGGADLHEIELIMDAVFD